MVPSNRCQRKGEVFTLVIDEEATVGATARLSLSPGGKKRAENFSKGMCASDDMEEEGKTT